MKKSITPKIISTEIFRLQNKILENIDNESISVYLFLKKEYARGDIKNNDIFQFIFRAYYRLDNAGLSLALKIKFFELLDREVNDLKDILKKLYVIRNLRGQNTVQFSFATKLLHTLDNNTPIFDSEIGTVIRKNVSGISGESKIQSGIELYKHLKYIYSELLKDKVVLKIILKFRKRFKVDRKKMSDTKALDFILWSLGKLKKD